MHTLIIGTPELKQAVEENMGEPDEVTWVHGLERAFTQLDVSDIDSIVFDVRSDIFNSPVDLKKLIAKVPVTTRVLAIVDQLPDEDIFSEAGVVYLTPPVNLDDIMWFIRNPPEKVQSG
ncbi:MAG: hypothetical protein HOC70_08050 [Gammaproteobacteria bacterium]|jgi:hypothetical protein|nr:hypothetical protein [Gammaproteobacteria bacterium]MBT4493183.1 hypothetical protein [Gammaproteobacteria bacterium]MBT7372291.1 hypothetical protein [Gammaproteobacteria bacterium]